MNQKEGCFVSALTMSALNNMPVPQENGIRVLALLNEEDRITDSSSSDRMLNAAPVLQDNDRNPSR